MNKLVYNEEVKNMIELNSFKIIILKGNNIIQHWEINPAYSSIRIDGVSYKFDTKLLDELSKKYPLDYDFYEKEFQNIDEYSQFSANLNDDKNFLFAYEPDFEFEGTFEIEFPKNDQFKSPKTISGFLNPKLQSILNEDKYKLTYIADNYNLNNRNQFTMTIEGSKELYDKINLGDLRQKNWKYNRASAMFFVRKN